MRECARKKVSNILFDTDDVAKETWLHLLRDFRCAEGSAFGERAEEAFRTSISSFRDFEFPELGEVKPLRFKRYKQLQHFFKKYRFRDDAYSDTDLEELTYLKFFKEQERIATCKQRTPLTHCVIQRARQVAKRILGQYSPEDTLLHARFGRKSSIGCPLSLAYLDEKLSNSEHITSSRKCATWFTDKHLKGDSILSKRLPTLEPRRLAHESLNLVFVPKSWKIHRAITPLTLISLFYSYGVGHQIEERLASCGLNIKHLQEKHRRHVEKSSVHRKTATADLSCASDSLTSELLNSILPREWYNAVRKTFCTQLVYDNKQHYTASVLPMGNGLTFPLETLVFYSLLVSLSELTGIRGFISVYGDDLIYPAGLHNYVSVVFPMLGLVLNSDKTFVTSGFRESCGSDYYHGVDVRPAFFSSEGHRRLNRKQLGVFIYQVINSLRRRWPDEQISSTLYYLMSRLVQCVDTVYRVPPSFPDTAGIKVKSIDEFESWIYPLEPIKLRFTMGSRWYHFRFLAVTAEKRVVKAVWPYYWLQLSGKSATQLDDQSCSTPDNFWDTDYTFMREVPSSVLTWEKCTIRYSVVVNGRKIPRKEVRYKPVVPSRTVMKMTVRTSTSSDQDGLNLSDWV